jgi:hypothetical protein
VAKRGAAEGIAERITGLERQADDSLVELPRAPLLSSQVSELFLHRLFCPRFDERRIHPGSFLSGQKRLQNGARMGADALQKLEGRVGGSGLKKARCPWRRPLV